MEEDRKQGEQFAFQRKEGKKEGRCGLHNLDLSRMLIRRSLIFPQILSAAHLSVFWNVTHFPKL